MNSKIVTTEVLIIGSGPGGATVANQLSKKNIDCKFIIQFSKNIYADTENIKKQIIDISKTNHNIKIIDGYVDFWAYRNYLKEINIMPLLYDADKVLPE